MRNFANYDVDIHGKSSGVLKTICKKCLPTRKNKRDRSLRVNVDTGHCHSTCNLSLGIIACDARLRLVSVII